ncbi:beta-glucosidase [candidate division KSB1 bacterium]|nr:beta-glucosidase [candidate division KSB1 bacterium]
MSESSIIFPDGFLWGCGSSSYQIEGAYDLDGKGESIWDRFSKTPGKTYNGETGNSACNHYHRYAEDIDLMVELGLKVYRFSISWSRVFPQGKGSLNAKGIDFYDKLIDKLLAKNIQPFATLYHWDLPQALQENGGWENRDTIKYFQDYTGEISRQFGDRIAGWVTQSEPAVASFLGHYQGIHAPGVKNLKAALQVSHHLLLSHGFAVARLRENIKNNAEIGISLNLTPSHPASNSKKDREAAERNFAHFCGWFLEPIFNKRYPEELETTYQNTGLFPMIEPDDLKIIAADIDFLGVNYYMRDIVRNAPYKSIWGLETIKPPSADYTAMGWEIYPDGLHEILEFVNDCYHPKKIYITENGAAFRDNMSENGEVHDPRRVSYLRSHFAQAHRAIQKGIPLAGYFVRSLLDGFEWVEGYTKRFGIIYVDYPTQKRILKDSAHWYKKVIEHNGLTD